jgi:insertion element IS1 protein InsB
MATAVMTNLLTIASEYIAQTYMTPVESENTRIRQNLARLHRKTLCYSKSEEMLKLSIVAVLKKVRYALCPMPTDAYALCQIVPHLSLERL